MAYMMDELGNVIGEFESEEERRQREEAAKQLAHKVEVKTYGDGSQTQTTTQEIPAPGPVSPDTFARMQQAESGNRDYDAQGRPIISSAGAMFRNQVMPATAAQPGFGIRPAASQTPEEYNRVGQEYYQAMLKKFGGNEQAAAAAYNAGPGTVERNMAANQGQLNVAQLPQETQGYLGKIGQAVTNIFPNAQAGTLPPGQAQQAPTITPVAPQTQPAINPETGETYQQLVPVSPQEQQQREQERLRQAHQQAIASGAAASSQPTTQGNPYFNRFQDLQNDGIGLMAVRSNENASEFERKWAGDRLFEMFKQDAGKAEGTKQATQLMTNAGTGDRKAANELARIISSPEGSWTKMILLSYISPQLAGEEAIKLGFGNKWQSTSATVDGKPVNALVEYNAKGLPLRGVDESGRALTTEQLALFGTSGAGKKLDIVGGSYVSDTLKDKNGQPLVGRMVSDTKSGLSWIQTDEGLKPMAGFRPQSSMGSLGDMRARQIQELNLKLQGKTEEEKMAILRPYNQALVGAGAAPIDPSEVGIRAPQISGGAAPAGPVVQGSAVPPPSKADQALQSVQGGGAGTMPAPATAAPAVAAAGGRPTMAQIEAGAAASKEIAKEAGKEVAISASTRNLINSIDNKVIPILESGKHNIGSELSMFAGRGPVAQAIGRQFETEDAKNTKTVMDTVNKLATEGLKTLGSNPSTADLRFWTENKPQANSDPEFMKEWIESRSEDLKRRLGYAQKQTEKGGTAGLAPEVNPQLSPRDQQALDWAMSNPKDPRAAEIRRRLGR